MKIKHIVISSFLLLSSSIYSQNKELTNELIWYSNEFSPDYLRGGKSLKDGEHFTKIERTSKGTAIVKYAYKNFQLVETIVSQNELKFNNQEIPIQNYIFSSDEKKILIGTNIESIYRHSSKGIYFIYDIESKKTIPVDPDFNSISLPEFSPNGKLVSYVKDNNIYISDFNTTTQITFDGSKNKIINGATDWVYEEEFAFDKGYYWSPESDYIAFYRFNETNVKEVHLPIYNGLYPESLDFKYPKAGQHNSVVDIRIYNINNQSTTNCDLKVKDTNYYIPRILWTNNNLLTIQKLNRHQNHLEFLIVDPTKPTLSNKYFEEKNDKYIEITDNVKFLKMENAFFFTSERNGWNHIYKYDIKKQKATQITKGSFEVIDIESINEEKGLIYFTSTEIKEIEKHLFVIDYKGKNKKHLSVKNGYNDVDFSANSQYYINYNTTTNTPYFITLNNANGTVIDTLVDNERLNSTLASYAISPKKFINFTTKSNVNLNAWMITPPDFDSTKTYPLFMTVYNGPGHNTVLNQWEGSTALWYQYLAQQGYIVVSVDGRGTMFRGEEFKKCTYLQLGKLETIDQIEAAIYLGKLPYVDANRIGIQGWSYGGYMSSLCITKGADVFKTAIAVAPVTNWRYYDSVYTERFMRTPEENEDGYDDNSPINHVDKLKGNYLLIHGSGDDNVHIQNSMEMIKKLVENNKQFEYMVYPNKNHSIYGGTTRLHLFTKMTDFILKTL